MPEVQTTPPAGPAGAPPAAPAQPAVSQPPVGLEKFWDAEKGQLNVENLKKSHAEATRKLAERVAGGPIPSPFDDATDPAKLGESYLALQRKIGATAASALEISPTPAKGQTDDNAGVDDLVIAAGLDPADLNQRFVEKGELTPAQYAKLKEAGLPRKAVDQFFAISAQYAEMVKEKLSGQFVQLAGGQEQLDTMVTWARANLKPADLQWYNGEMNAAMRDPQRGLRTFEWLLGKYRQSVGAERGGTPLEGGGTAGAVGYTTAGEMDKALLDRRMSTDPAFRAQVQARLKATHKSLAGA